jgi:hypothetical protein
MLTLPCDVWHLKLRVKSAAESTECRAGRSIVFILADFHLFMKRARPTTIYNLLDSLQALHVCAVVIGMSSDMNAVDYMEKRTRSRFSDKRVVIPRLHAGATYSLPGQGSCATSTEVQTLSAVCCNRFHLCVCVLATKSHKSHENLYLKEEC